MKYYYDLLSQPSRALFIFLKLSKIPFEAIPVALRNGEHLSEQFKIINRFQKVPCITEEDGFKMSESVAIFRYLTTINPSIDDHWYPKETRARALVDEFLEWQHNNVRIACAMYFQTKWLRPLMDGKEPSANKLSALTGYMETTLDLMENVWLESTEKRFLTSNEISFADIIAACEIEQTRIADYDPFAGRPKLSKWWDDVKEETNPYYDEAHRILNKIVAKKSKL